MQIDPGREKPIVRVLGTVCWETDTEVVSPGGPSPRILLGILATRAGTSVSSDYLAEAIWADSLPANPQSGVQVIVSRLRTKLKPLGISIERQSGGYQLDLGPDCSVDALEFESACASCRSDLAAGNYSGAILHAENGFNLWRGSPFGPLGELECFETAAARWNELRAGLVEDKAEAMIEKSDLAGAVLLLGSHVVEFPYRERPVGQLMLALHRSGRTAEALEVFDDARTRLLSDLGLDPGENLKSLEHSILTADSSLSVNKRIERPVERPQLAGRVEVFRRLEGLLANERDVLVIGAAGTGKSALLANLASVVSGRCLDLDGAPPFAPWLDLLSAALLTVDDAGASTVLLDQAISDLAKVEEVGVFGSSRSVLAAVESCFGLVGALVLEDVQWADPGSVQLASFVIRSARADRPSLIVTSRLRPETDLANLDTIELGPLDRSAVAALVSARLGLPVSESVIDRLHAATMGVPVLVMRAVDQMLSGEEVPVGDGQWLTRSWLEPVREIDREFLEAAALVGESFGLEVVAGVCDLSGEQAMSRIDSSISSRVLKVTSDPSVFVFSDGLIRRGLLAEIPPGRAAQKHLRIAEYLEKESGIEKRLSEIATHYGLARPLADPGKVLEVCLPAAKLASKNGSHGAAGIHIENAIGAAQSLDLNDEQRAEVELTAGEVLWLKGDTDAARSRFAALAERLSDDDPTLPDLVARYAGFGMANVELDEVGFALLGRVAGDRDTDSSAVTATRVRCRTRGVIATRDELTLVASGERLEAEARETGDPLTLCWALGVSLIALMTMSGVTKRAEKAQLMLTLGEELGNDDAIGLGLVHLADTRVELGLFDEAETAIGRINSLAGATGRPAHRWYAEHYLGALLVARGDSEQGRHLVDSALAVGIEAHLSTALEAYGGALFVDLAAKGEAGSLLELSAANEPPGIVASMGLDALELGLAWCALDAGETDRAMAGLASVMANIGEIDIDRVRSIELAQLIDVGMRLGDRDAVEVGVEWLSCHSGRNCTAPGLIIMGAADVYLGLGELFLGNEARGLRLLDDGQRQNQEWGLEVWSGYVDSRRQLLIRAND